MYLIGLRTYLPALTQYWLSISTVINTEFYSSAELLCEEARPFSCPKSLMWPSHLKVTCSHTKFPCPFSKPLIMSYISIIPHLSYLFAVIKSINPFIHPHTPSFSALKACAFPVVLYLFEKGGRDQNWIKCLECGYVTDLYSCTAMFSALFSSPFLAIPPILAGVLVCFDLLLNWQYNG